MEQNRNTAEYNFEGFLKGHGGLVTSIIVGSNETDENDTILVTGSRDKTIMIWNLTQENAGTDEFGVAYKSLTGHNHFVTDLTISKDNFYVISSSWDKTLRLWDIRYGNCLERFDGHDKEIHTVTFSEDNRQIFSGGSERDIRIWNTLGECKVKSESNNHNHWVSKIRYSSSPKNSYYASVGRDGRLKIWNGIFKLYASIKAHDNYINALALSRNGEYIATGGKDKEIKIWNYNDLTKPQSVYNCESEVNSIAFSTKYQWIAGACDDKVVIYGIKTEGDEVTNVTEIEPEPLPQNKEAGVIPKATAIAWSANSQHLYIGCDDGVIRVYSIQLSVNN